MSGRDVLTVLLIAAVAGAGGVGAGVLALRLLRRRSLRAAIAVVALTSALVVAASVAATGAIMLVDGHALAVLLTAVVSSAVAGLLVGSLLGRQVARGSAELREAIRRVGSDEPASGLDSRPPGELAAIADELALARERLAQSRDREGALEASRRELISWISHDLRTPLAGIRAMAEALEDGVVIEPSEVADYHRGLRTESDRLAGMVDELFELSRIQAGSMPSAPEVIDLRTIAEEAIGTATPLARARDIEMILEATSSAAVLADRRHLLRAVGNVLANALRHSPDAGRVTVEVGGVDGENYVAVADECGGVAPEHLPRLFDVGYRTEQARTPASETGAGLGLAITRGIVQANGGTATVANAGPGCRFTLRLPSATRPSATDTLPQLPRRA